MWREKKNTDPPAQQPGQLMGLSQASASASHLLLHPHRPSNMASISPVYSRASSFPDTSHLRGLLATEGDLIISGSWELPEDSRIFVLRCQFFPPWQWPKTQRASYCGGQCFAYRRFILEASSPGLCASSVSSSISVESLSSSLRVGPITLVGSQNWAQCLAGLDQWEGHGSWFSFAVSWSHLVLSFYSYRKPSLPWSYWDLGVSFSKCSKERGKFH